MMGFQSFWSAAVTLAGIELLHMIRKGRWTAGPDCVRRTSSIRWPADFHAGHARLLRRAPGFATEPDCEPLRPPWAQSSLAGDSKVF